MVRMALGQRWMRTRMKAPRFHLINLPGRALELGALGGGGARPGAIFA